MTRYNVVYADPPWYFNRAGQVQDGDRPRRFISDHYKLMTLAELHLLPVDKIAAPDAILFLWSTDDRLPSAIELMQAWGFRYCTVGFYWVKKTGPGNTCFNVGCWTMKSVEQCLIGLRGHPTRLKIKRNVRQLVEAQRTTHSTKPGEVRSRISELTGDVPKIELFAREHHAGWDCWGDEVKPTGKRMERIYRILETRK